MSTIVRLIKIAALGTILVGQVSGQTSSESALIAKARAIHHRVIKIDTHNDIDPNNFTADCNYTMRLTTQVNLPKMDEGDMNVSFMIVYVGQGPLTPAGYDNAYRLAMAKFDAIHRLTEQIAPNRIGLALTPADVIKLHAQGKRIAVIGVENGYPIGTDIQRVQEFYDRGGRYMSLAHNGNSQLSDSNTGEKDGYLYNNGLSPLGRQVIAEMNRLGMMVDVSHPSKGSMMEAVRLSKAPIIASHSAIRALANVSRNMDGEQLLALKKNGGVIQIVALSGFLKPGPAAGNSGAGGAANPPAGASAPATPRCPIERSAPAAPPSTPARANVKDFVNHIDYAVKLIGIDHVGISSDFDGGGGIDGWNSAAEAFNVTLELVRRGYTEQQIAKLWGGNLLRVWTEVEKVGKELRKK